jgi:hypothetical protein
MPVGSDQPTALASRSAEAIERSLNVLCRFQFRGAVECRNGPSPESPAGATVPPEEWCEADCELVAHAVSEDSGGAFRRIELSLARSSVSRPASAFSALRGAGAGSRRNRRARGARRGAEGRGDPARIAPRRGRGLPHRIGQFARRDVAQPLGFGVQLFAHSGPFSFSVLQVEPS